MPGTRRDEYQRNGRGNGAMSSCCLLPLLLVLLCHCIALVSAEDFPFYWYYEYQDDFTIPQCAIIDFGVSDATNNTLIAYPPYTLTIHPVGMVPDVFPPSKTSPNVTYPWVAAYLPNTQLVMAWADSRGQSGGAGRLYSMQPAQSNVSTNDTCRLYSQSTTNVQFTLSNYSPALCEEVTVSVTGGVAPYVIQQVLIGDKVVNTTIRGQTGTFVNKLSAGASFLISLVDAKGTYANTTGLLMSAGGSNGTCLVPDSPRKWPEIVGIVVSVVAVITAAILFWLYRRRAKRHRAELLAAQTAALSKQQGQNGHGIQEGQPYFANGGMGGMAGRNGEKFQVNGQPSRFRVTNPDDGSDARSSWGTSTAAGFRDSADTIRMNSLNSRGLGMHDGHGSPGARLPLIREDYNAMYPPTSGSDTMVNPGSMVPHLARGGGMRNDTFGDGKFNDDDEDMYNAWPTVRSSASSATEDHYMDEPASSAGILGRGNSLRDGNTASSSGKPGPASTHSGSGLNGSSGSSSGGTPGAVNGTLHGKLAQYQWRQVQPEELDSPMEEYDDEEEVWTPTADSVYEQGGSYMTKGSKPRQPSSSSQHRPAPPTISMIIENTTPPLSAVSQHPDSPFADRARFNRPPDAEPPTPTVMALAEAQGEPQSESAAQGQRTPQAQIHEAQSIPKGLPFSSVDPHT